LQEDIDSLREELRELQTQASQSQNDTQTLDLSLMNATNNNISLINYSKDEANIMFRH
jgi:hypothetical protein